MSHNSQLCGLGVSLLSLNPTFSITTHTLSVSSKALQSVTVCPTCLKRLVVRSMFLHKLTKNKNKKKKKWQIPAYAAQIKTVSQKKKVNNPPCFCCFNKIRKTRNGAWGVQLLKRHLTQIKDWFSKHLGYCGLSYSRKQISLFRFFNLWPVIRPFLISQYLFFQQVYILKTFYACVTRETGGGGGGGIVMVWCDKVIRTPLRASLWMIQSLTGTAMLVINTLNYQGGNVCLCVSGFPWVCIPYTNGCLPNYVSNYQCGVLQMCVHSYTDSVYAFEREKVS